MLEIIQGLTPYTSQAVLACTANAPAEKQRCLANLSKALRTERDQTIAAVDTPAFLTGAIFTVVQKTNYEGNYVTYVDMRQRGTDRKWQWKMLLKNVSGRWVVAEKTEKGLD